MKQILQNLGNGETSLIDVPCPKNSKGNLLIASRNSLVSAGTERMLVDFGKASLLEKARQQPDKVKQVVDKVKTDGLFTTVDAVRSKLDQPLPLGYCNAGIVLESDVEGFEVGDRVVSSGAHAEVVRVPKNLCVKIPDLVDDESAAFTVLGAIGLQGIRLIKPTLGEAIVVTGLGLIGLMCVQMLRANGCRVLGIDFDSRKCELARGFGAETVDLSLGEDPITAATAFSRGRGVDGVVITAASKSDEIMHQSAEMCRKRGRIVLVGVVGLNLRRDDFFKKEITFQVSASYGPGRYDPEYEERGHDYPFGFVRWTEQRNFEAVLDMMVNGTLDVKCLITHRLQIDDAVNAYEQLSNPEALGILIEYPHQNKQDLRKETVVLSSLGACNIDSEAQQPVIGCIGAGNYASRILIPAMKNAGAILDTLVTSGGISGVHHGKKAGFRKASTDICETLKNKDINTIIIATRHDAHAEQVFDALNAGKHVFVEKPLAIVQQEVDKISDVFLLLNKKNISPPRLMIGFNRRFAPHIVKMKELLSQKNEPKVIIVTVNAGAIPKEHWVQDPLVGGRRIIGEGCHFIDLMRFLVGQPITQHQGYQIGNAAGIEVRDDKVSIQLSFSDGSIGTIHYLANGGKSFPKERVEVFCGNSILQMDNYRTLKGFDWHGFSKMNLRKQDKGQEACITAFLHAIRDNKPTPIPLEEIIEVSTISIAIADTLI